jgi:polyhydroxybutyrate depolymerase
VDDVGFINALIDTLINRNALIDLERIYVCGWSAGGFMTYTLACQLSHRIAAIASVGGLFISSVSANYNSLHTMPVLHMHGTKDNIVHPSGGEDALSADQIINYFTALNGCVQIDTLLLPDLDTLDKSTVEKISYTDCSDSSNVIYYRVIDGGHSWPGGVIDYDWAGNRNMDINAGVEILNFFKNHKLVIPVGSFESFIPQEFKLIQNHPNPFYQTTTIEFELNKTSQVTLRIINILGEEVATLVSDRLNAGSYNYKWDAGNQASGIYLCRLQVGAFTQMTKMMLFE